MNVLWRSLARMSAKLIFLLSVAGCFGTLAYASEGIITTVAGSGTAGFSGDGGLAVNAQFNSPVSVAIDSANNLYIADLRNQRIRKVDTKGNISTVVGSGPAGPISGFSFGGFSGDGGLATNAQLDHPSHVAVDSNNNLYIADRDNYCIRKVDSSGIISTIAGVGNVASITNSYGVGDGGIATAAKFHQIEGVAIDNIGNVYIAEFFDHIRKVDISNIVSTVAGEIYGDGNSVPHESGFSGDGGPAVDALFSGISGIAIDSKANIYIADRGNHRIRKVDGNGIISTVVGNGESGSSGDGKAAIDAKLVSPVDIEIDNNGNLYIADSGDCRIRKVSSTGIISTVAGNGKCGVSGDGGTATNAQIYPYGITVDNDGNLYIAEFKNNRIRKVTFSNDIPPVTTNQPPVANFIVTPVQGETPLTVTLDASLSSDPDGSIVSYQWSVNGQTLSGKTVSVTLDKAGDYLIALTVTDDKGATGTKTDKITVNQPVATNQPPKADYYVSPNNGQAPLIVTLDASPSTDSDGSIVSYQWSVNGQILSGKTVTVTLENAGNYPVTLTVTDDKGATSTVTYAITVTQPAVTLAPKIRIEPTALNFDNVQNVRTGLRDNADSPVEIHKTVGNQELFVNFSQTEENSSDPTITRVRYAKVNLNALSQPDAAFGTVYTEQLILNLFSDVSFTVNNLSINYRGNGDYTWIGKIDGTQFGDVILVVKDGRITGNVNAQGEVYRIRPSQDGWHAIQKMNPAAFPEDAPSVLPPSSTLPEPLPSDETQNSQLKSARANRENGTPIIDVMVVYTPVAARTPTDNNVNIVSEIQLAIDETNQIYANSAIKQRLRLVHTEQVNYTEKGIYDANRSVDLHRLSNINDGFIDEVHRLRDEYKADLVSLWVEDEKPPYCGVGFTMNSKHLSKNFAANGFTVVERHCATAPVYAFAHELGHNMGAHHEKEALFKNEPTGCLKGAAYPYSCGYVHDTVGKNDSWRTIMAYGTVCKNGCTRVPYFSNPDIMYNGIATGDASANNALTLNNTADIIASFRESSDLLTGETKNFTIYNDGSSELVVSSIVLENSSLRGVSVIPSSVKIAPGSSTQVKVTVNYSQVPVGQTRNRLLISSNDLGNLPYPVEIIINRQTDSGVNTAADSFDIGASELSLTASAFGGTYQATLNTIELRPEVVGSTFALGGAVQIFGEFLDNQITNYDPVTGIVEIPIGFTYLGSGEPVLFTVQMKETSPGVFEITNFFIIPVPITE